MARLGPVALLAALLVPACGAGAQAPTPHLPGEARSVPTAQVNDDGFARAVRDLLTTPARSAERGPRLEGVLSRQMDRAYALFRRRSAERGLAAVKGALYFLRPGELQDKTLGPHGVDALTAAVKELAQRGDEGRSRAVYEILKRVAPEAARGEAQAHLEALSAWTKDGAAEDGLAAGQQSGVYRSMEGPENAQRVALMRALLEPSADALNDASNATRLWFNAASHPVQVWSRYDRVEAVRARQSAAATLMALYLRDGDPRGAIEALGKDDRLRQTAPHRLYNAVVSAADRDEAERWREVLDALVPNDDDNEDEPVIDRELLTAALVTVASEAYRADPTLLRPAVTLAELLQAFGMGEASPAVLVDTCKAHPDAASLDPSLFITDRALEAATDADDPDAARRTFKAAEPILAIAEKAKVPLKVTPAHIRGTMGEIELREGKLDVARDLLKSATSAEPSPGLLLDLARIERHDGDAAGAMAHLKAALEAASEVAQRAEISLVASDMLVSQGDAEGARKMLGDALTLLLAERGKHDAVTRARVERAIARIFDRFGLFKQGDDALQRALDATPRDKTQLAATLALSGSRAVIHNDVRGARAALSRSVAADLQDEDVVYFALWARAVERKQHVTSDGVPERVFASITDDGSWAAKLAAFGTGKLPGDDLLAAAQSPSKRVEAMFYVALDRRSKGDKGADDVLKQVALGAGVDLIEADVAKQLVSPSTPLNPPASVVAATP